MTQLGIAFATLAVVGDLRADSPWLKCTLAGGSKGGVEIRVESTRTVDADVHTTLVLEPSESQSSPGPRGGYWAPVDVATGKRYGANQPRHLILRPGRGIVAVLSPAALLWDRQISGAWPSRKLQEAVPPGRYSLRLEVEEVATTQRARSNGVEVLVDAGGIAIVPERP